MIQYNNTNTNIPIFCCCCCILLIRPCFPATALSFLPNVSANSLIDLFPALICSISAFEYFLLCLGCACTPFFLLYRFYCILDCFRFTVGSNFLFVLHTTCIQCF